MAEVMDKRCGTYAGYKAHYNAKQEVCDLCAEARRAYWTNQRNIKKEYHASVQKAWKAANPEKYAEIHRNKSRKRRAVLRENGFSKYTEKELFDAYGTSCHICKEEIDLTASRRPGLPGWEYGLHIDHIVAISKGGSDTLDNVRPAHGICNLKRGAQCG